MPYWPADTAALLIQCLYPANTETNLRLHGALFKDFNMDAILIKHFSN